MMLMTRLSIALFLSALLTACGGGAWGGGGGDDDDDPANAPSAPVSLTANAGDRAISLGWGVPATNATGTITYEITLTPAAAAPQFRIEGTNALVTGLANDTTYTLSVVARNSAGAGPAASVQAKPAQARANDYAELAITDNSDGVTDPAPLRTAGGQIWLAYTGIAANGSGQITRSAIRLAQSQDNGATYQFDREISDPTAPAAGSPSGRWHYRTPWLIEDSTDPAATRRFKLFAHKYFFNPNDNSVDYQRGAIAMWTAAAPDGNWSNEEIVLGWNSGPAVLQPAVVVNSLNTALQSCLWISQGSASVGSDGIDFAFDCVTDSINNVRKIVLLRSADHTQTFSYVSTLLEPADALEYNGESFGMAALLPGAGNAPVLIASPLDIDGNARGCVVFPLADPKAGKLFIENNAPLALQTLPDVGDSSGACGWDRSIPRSGILMGNRTLSDYTFQATGKAL